MIVSLDLELKDVPGQLVSALKPISEFDGNIKSVIHHRDKLTARKTIPVQITFEIDESKLSPLIERLKSQGIYIAKVGENRLHESVLVILIGHILHSDIRDTIDAIDSTGYAEVVDLSMAMPGVLQRSSASLQINASGKEELDKALQILQGIAKRKNLLLILPIDR
jgi:ACT domain-containing protein